MRRTDQLITAIRRRTDNEDVSASEGISSEEFVDFLNEGQARLQSRIVDAVPDCTLFDTSKTTSLVAGQRAYAIASSTDQPLLGSMVRLVEYRTGSLEEDYYQLEPDILDNLSLVRGTYPSSYDIRNGNILVSPLPTGSNGTLRITFPRRLDALDIRRGKIDTVNTSGSNYTSIILEATPVPDDILDDTDFFICVNSKYGVVNYYNAPVTTYDTNSRTLTFDSGVSTSNGTISIGDWVTYGKWTTTHSQLPDDCERFLLAYAAWKVLKRDSTDDAALQEQELIAIENDILSALKDTKRQREAIPVSNYFYTV